LDRTEAHVPNQLNRPFEDISGVVFMFAWLSRLSLTCNLCLLCLTNLVMAQDEAIAEAIAEPAAVAAANAGLANATPDKPQPRPLTISVGLLDDTRLTGTLIDSNTIAIKTAFGEASIPLSEVAGIRFPASDDTSTTIVMLNGDSITGATDLKHVNIETVWGSAKINGANIGTLLFVPGLAWTSNEVLGGKRWSLVESVTQPATSAAASLGNAPASNSGIRVGNPQPLQPPPLPNNRTPQVIFGQ